MATVFVDFAEKKCDFLYKNKHDMYCWVLECQSVDGMDLELRSKKVHKFTDCRS